MVGLEALNGIVITAMATGGAPKKKNSACRAQRILPKNAECLFQVHKKSEEKDIVDPKIMSNHLPSVARNVLLIATRTAFDSQIACAGGGRGNNKRLTRFATAFHDEYHHTSKESGVLAALVGEDSMLLDSAPAYFLTGTLIDNNLGVPITALESLQRKYSWRERLRRLARLPPLPTSRPLSKSRCLA